MMARSIREIEQEVRALQTAERNQLLRELIADMDGEPEHGIKEAWLQEAQQRYKELQSGLVKPVPATDVIRKARSRLKNEN